MAVPLSLLGLGVPSAGLAGSKLFSVTGVATMAALGEGAALCGLFAVSIPLPEGVPICTGPKSVALVSGVLAIMPPSLLIQSRST